MEQILEKYGNIEIIRVENRYLPLYRTKLKYGPYGKLQSFIEDPNLEEIMYVSPTKTLKVLHRKYGMCDTDIIIEEEEILAVIENIAKYCGRTIDEKNPILNARLPDGSRVNATLPQVSPSGTTLTIRKFTSEPLTIVDLISNGTVSIKVMAYLWMFVEGLGSRPSNILISGGPSSGKTTLLNILSTFIPEEERIITIEETAELRLEHENWIRLEEATGIEMPVLLKNSLRMRPDRIIIGEIRGPEAFVLFNAMNTGQRGCMGTIHANSTKETIARVMSPPMNVPSQMLRNLDLIINMQRITKAGTTIRRIVEISETGGIEGNIPTLNTIFKLEGGMLKETGVPSILREKISNEVGISLKDFDSILFERSEVLDKIVVSNYRDVQAIHKEIQNYYKKIKQT